MRYIITLCLDNPAADLQAVKEALAYDCEKYGDLSLISIQAKEEPQETLWRKPERNLL